MMEITRDVVKDLLTVYLADEASADTRRLIEAYLETDPALAADVARAKGRPVDLPVTPPPSPTARATLSTRSSPATGYG